VLVGKQKNEGKEMNWTIVAGRRSVEPSTKGTFRWYFRKRKEAGYFDLVVCIPKHLCEDANFQKGMKVAVVSQSQDHEILYAMIEHPQGLRLAFGGGRSSDTYLRWSKTYNTQSKKWDMQSQELRGFVQGAAIKYSTDYWPTEGWPLVTPDNAIIFSSEKSKLITTVVTRKLHHV
jgi:hypothetical protein